MKAGHKSWEGGVSESTSMGFDIVGSSGEQDCAICPLFGLVRQSSYIDNGPSYVSTV